MCTTFVRRAKHWIKLRRMYKFLQSWFILKVIIWDQIFKCVDVMHLLFFILRQKIVGNSWTNSIEHNVLFMLHYKPSNAIDQNSFFCGVENGVEKKYQQQKWQQSKLRSTMTWWIVTIVIVSIISNEINFCIHFSPFRSLREAIKLYKIFVIFCWEIEFKVIFMESKEFHTIKFIVTPKLLIKNLKQPTCFIPFKSCTLYYTVWCSYYVKQAHDRIFYIHSKSMF